MRETPEQQDTAKKGLRRNDLTLVIIVLFVALILMFGLRTFRQAAYGTDTADASDSAETDASGGAEESAGNLCAYVTVDGKDVLRVPLTANGTYMVMDGTATDVEQGTTLESLGEDASPSKHDVNLIVLEDGSIRCYASNCDNQVCVHTAAITGGTYDTPIVCLPHGMFIYAEPDQ